MILPIVAALLFVLVDITLATRNDRQFNKQTKEEFLEEAITGLDSADAKDNFFRYVRAYDTGELNSEQDGLRQVSLDLPKPGGFKLPYLERFRRNIQLDDINAHIIDYYDISETEEMDGQRFSRAINDNVKIEATHVNIEESLGKPLEIGIIEANINVTTEQAFDKNIENIDVSKSMTNSGVGLPKGKALVINDFIRFRRDVKQQTAIDTTTNTNTNNNNNNNNKQVDVFNPAEGNPTPLRPKRDRQTAAKLVGPDPNNSDGANREPRGATTEQWVKQPYPVIHPAPGDRRYEDNMASPSGSLESAARAPRVNFITQRRSAHDSIPPLVYRSSDPTDRDDYYYYNGGNSRKESRMWQDLSQRPSAVMPSGGDMYYQRPYRQQTQYYDDPYFYETRDRRQYDPNRRYYDVQQDRYQPPAPSSVNRQRRIIYYTTLPEIVRTPPSVDMRDKYNKYGGYAGDRRYDGRYVTSSPLSVAGGGQGQLPSDTYRYRQPPPLYTDHRHMQKPRSPYDDMLDGEQGGPKGQGVKVTSGDVVAVRELKKNPERRIYGGGGDLGPDNGYKGPSGYASDQDVDRAAFHHGRH